MKLKYSVALIALAMSSPLFAQTSEQTEVIKVSGTRLQDLPVGAVSSITRAQIEQLNPASTLDLLKRLPHIDVTENGNAGGFSYVSIRGGEFNFTLVTIDGIAVNDSTNSRGGGFDFNQINPAAIERIDVYRGGINTIYGGDAVSGVINIITRDTTSPVITAEVGTDKQLNASITGSTKLNENASILGSVSTQNKEVSAFEEVTANQLLVKASHSQNALLLSGLLTYNETDVKSFTEDSGGQLYAVPQQAEERDSEQWIMGLGAQYQIDSNWVINSQLSWLKREEFIANPGIAEGVQSGIPASDITSEYERLEFDLYTRYQANANTSFVVGANHRQQDGNNRGFLDYGFQLPVDYDFSQDIDSVYAEAQHKVNQLTLEVSARYDAPDSFDNESTFRVGAEFAINEDTQVFAVFNQGYKLPSFFALAHPLVGNSELEPERSDNFEVGFNQQITSSLGYSVVYFENQFEDLIDFDAELFTNVNRNSVDTSGVEFDLTSSLSSDIELVANVRYLDIDAGADVTLRKRPNISGNLRVDFSFDNASTSIYMDFRDDYADSSIATGYRQLPGYASIGASGVISVSDALDLTFNVNNALGKRIEDSVGFVHDDVEARIGVVYRL